MDQQNTPQVIMSEGEWRYSDEFLNDPGLDAAVVQAEEELQAFVAEHREVLQGTEFAQAWDLSDPPGSNSTTPATSGTAPEGVGKRAEDLQRRLDSLSANDPSDLSL